jgi:hypothetical protein
VIARLIAIVAGLGAVIDIGIDIGICFDWRQGRFRRSGRPNLLAPNWATRPTPSLIANENELQYGARRIDETAGQGRRTRVVLPAFEEWRAFKPR